MPESRNSKSDLWVIVSIAATVISIVGFLTGIFRLPQTMDAAKDSVQNLVSDSTGAKSNVQSSGEHINVSAQESLAIVQDNMKHRAEADEFMRLSPESPFNRDTSARYDGLKWFPIDPRFRVRSVLHRYTNPETVSVFGTKGEERRNLRYGYFAFDVPDEAGKPATLRMDVYKFTPHDKKRYELYRNMLSLWFTDKTTGKETYRVGRYIELGEENADKDFEYTIDFNKAFNPYCAYSDLFSCAIPRKEDHLDIALRVGEMKYIDRK